MNQLEKLDKIVLEDRLNLSSEEILDRVLYIANERAQLYGWYSFELKALDDKTMIKDGWRRFEFDVWGLSEEQLSTKSNQGKSSEESSHKERYVASSHKEVGL